MRVLFFTYDFPYPTTSGGKNRAYNMLKFGNKEVEYVLFSFYRQVPSDESIRAVENIGVKKIRLFKRPLSGFGKMISSGKLFSSPEVFRKLANPFTSVTKKLYFQKSIQEELLKTIQDEKIDVVHFESLYTAYFMSDEIERLGIPQIFGTENIEHILYKNFAKNTSRVLRPFYLFEAEKIKKDEDYLLKKADQTLAVSQEDAEYIILVTGKKPGIIANGVDTEEFAFKPSRKKQEKTKLLFVGNFSYFPNVEGIERFYKDIFSRLGEEFELEIIGKDSRKLFFSRDKKVRVKEFVEDIKQAYYEADIFVFPVTIGGGTNFKLLEAMACGLPVIAYPQRINALQAKPGKDLLTADTAKDFQEKIVELTDDDELRRKITTSARKLVEENFSWEVIGKKLNKVWKSYEKN